MNETYEELEKLLFEQRKIIEQFHNLLGVYTTTSALSKVSVLMREEEDLLSPAIKFACGIRDGIFHGHGFDHPDEPCNCNENAAIEFLQKLGKE